MPDFDALIRHQQLKQSRSNERLELVVDNETTSDQPTTTVNYLSITGISFITGLISSVACFAGLIYLLKNNFIQL